MTENIGGSKDLAKQQNGPVDLITYPYIRWESNKFLTDLPTLGSDGSRDLLTSVAQLSKESALLFRRRSMEGSS